MSLTALAQTPFQLKTDHHKNCIVPSDEIDCTILDEEITETEVIGAIKALKNGKAGLYFHLTFTVKKAQSSSCSKMIFV